MVEKVRKYLLEHVPLANEFKEILVDFLGEDPTSYSIEPILTDTIVKQYSDGGTLRQFIFQFSSREFYDNSVIQNIENLGFYENFSKAIEYNNYHGILPEIDGVQSIKCNSGGVLENAESGTAKYNIQMTIEYYKDNITNEIISI